MAIYNENLSARFSRAILRLFSLKGPNTAAKQISGEIMPVLPLFFGVEARKLEGWERFSTAAVLAAGGAGNFGALRLRNPSGSGEIAVIEKASVWGPLTDTPRMQLAAQATDFAVPGPGNRIDPRSLAGPTVGTVSSGMLVSTSTSGTNLAATLQAATFAPNTVYDFILFEDQEITLLPGDAFQLISNVANQAFNANILWRERVLEESERT